MRTAEIWRSTKGEHGRRKMRWQRKGRLRRMLLVANGCLIMHDLHTYQMSTPGVEPGLSRPQRDVLTTRRCRQCKVIRNKYIYVRLRNNADSQEKSWFSNTIMVLIFACASLAWTCASVGALFFVPHAIWHYTAASIGVKLQAVRSVAGMFALKGRLRHGSEKSTWPDTKP